jgi:hypothetical protein
LSLKAHSVMDSRSAEFPAQGTQAIGVSKIDHLPWDEEPLLLLPKVDYLNNRVSNPFGGGRRSFGAPFLLYPLQNTHQVEAESKKLIELHKAPLEPEKEKADLEQSTIEPPQTLEDRKDLIESQSKVAPPSLPAPAKSVPFRPDQKPEFDQSESTPLGQIQSEDSIPSAPPPRKRKNRLLV